MTCRVTIIALPNVLASAVAGTLDVLTAANVIRSEPMFDVGVRSTAAGPVRSSSGLSLGARPGLPARQQHAVVVAGLGVTSRDGAVESVVRRAQGSPRLFAWLHRQHKGGAMIVANCAATFLLAESGLLHGRTATTTWWLAGEFSRRYPQTQLNADALVVSCDRIVTGGAAMSHLDLALHIVERFAGAELARLCAKYLVLDQTRESQAPYVIPEHVRSLDPLVQKAATLLRANLRRRVSVAAIAKRLGTTPRTLARRFKRALGQTPHECRQRARIDRARQLLEARQLRVEDIAASLGYAEPSAFYRAFVKSLHIAPRDYQRRFGVPER